MRAYAAPVWLAMWMALAPPASAQETGSAPAVFRRSVEKARTNAAAVQMTAPDARLALDAPSAELRAKLTGGARAVHRELPAGLLSRGEWTAAGDGRAVWRLAIESPGAMMLRLHFTGFDAAAGELRMGGPRNSFLVAETGSEFWSQAAFGSEMWLEYAPRDASSRELPFSIDLLSHYFPPERTGVASGLLSPVASGAPEPVLSAAAQPKEAASCHLNVTCYPEFRDASSGVALLLTERGGVGYVCSGALIATTSGTFHPYLLTANHCLSNQLDAYNTRAYFFYEASLCNLPAGGPPIEYAVFRANYLGGRGWNGGDWTLLELSDKPDNAQWLGWTTVELAKGRPAVGIHHPGGDYKRIHFGTRVDDEEFYIGDPADGVYGAPSQYYTVELQQGMAQPGSSGSPVLNEFKQITGVLSAGPASEDEEALCKARPFNIFYGRFTQAYPFIRQYLEDYQPARMVSPAPGSALTSTAVDFSWSGGVGPSEYLLAVGTTPGASNLFYQNTGPETFRRVTRLPGDGSTIHVRLWFKFRDEWRFADYTYRAYSDPGVKVRINVNNRLLYPVNVKVNGEDFATVPASGSLAKDLTGTSAVEVTYEMIRPVLAGRPLGDEVKGWFPGTGSAQGTLNFTITNETGTERVFAPLVTNGALEPLLLEVNANTPAVNRCDCTVAAGAQNFGFGYYRLLPASNVRTYRSGSNYTGGSIGQQGIGQFVQPGSGAMRLYFDRLP